jgi:hypothetical protein
MKRAYQTVLLAGALWFQCAAQAGQLTLYTDINFSGRAVTVQGATRDFGALGFNDRASSMVIASGRWEVCVDADFRGRCEFFERGEYARIDGWNDNISSAREVGGRGDQRGRGEQQERGRGEPWQQDRGRDERGRDDHGRDEREERGRGEQWQQERGRGEPGRGAMLELFSQPNFSGARMSLSRDARNLSEFDFNDRATSIVVQGGEWEVCVHADFGGQCRVVGPGRYARLGPMDQQISSVRRLR